MPSISEPDPDWIRIQSVSGSGFGIRIRILEGKMTHKNGKNLEISCFEVLDDLFRGLKASSVA
jgi:hypothetical protein